MTKFCRTIVAILLLSGSSAVASANSQLWSNEFSPISVNEASSTPFYWGINWVGSVPRSENEDRLFSLGSVKKIITSATALRELGSEFKFSNEFTADLDAVSETVFSPSFSVSGDPTWAHPSYGETLSSRVNKVVLELKRLNVKRVVGEIQINLLRPAVGQFKRPTEWKNEWLSECYAALPTAISLNGNCAVLSINSLKKVNWLTPGVGTPIEFKLFASKNNSLMITPYLDSFGRVEKYKVTGGFATAMTVAIPVHNNESWLKNIFVQELKKYGINYLVQSTKFVRSVTSTPVYVDLSSIPLKDILVPFLQESINLVGDRLHIEAGEDLITLASLIPDPIEYQNVTLLDGSGLIAEDKISPKTFYHVLTSLISQPYFQDLYAGLPVSGVSGTLQNRMNDALLINRVHAKTGTLDGVANLAGYWIKSDQKMEPFVIFTESDQSSQTARSKIDAVVGEFARKN